jgi:hypothetical protein
MFLVTCRLFELYGRESSTRLLAKELPPLQGVGQQKCMSFSVDGSKFATGGVVSKNNNPNIHYHMVSSPFLKFFISHQCTLVYFLIKYRMGISESWSGQACVLF